MSKAKLPLSKILVASLILIAAVATVANAPYLIVPEDSSSNSPSQTPFAYLTPPPTLPSPAKPLSNSNSRLYAKPSLANTHLITK